MEMETKYYCPICGHEFEQGEYDYNYDYNVMDYECTLCGWHGTEPVDITTAFIEYAKERSKQSVGTSYEWDFNKLYPTEDDVDYFIAIIAGHPKFNWETGEHWDDIIDWFENLPNY
jgi:outer membrane protein assembly factor BamD (BamD/ComL family)